MNIFYTMAYGCNSRHLHNVEIFEHLRDAKKYAKTQLNAYVLERHEEPTPYERVTKVLARNVI